MVYRLGMKPLVLWIAAGLALLGSPSSPASDDPLSAGSRAASVGILPFRDETGRSLSETLKQQVARLLQQRLAVQYKDLLPTVLEAGFHGTATPNFSQLATLGKANGVDFVVSGGFLAIRSEKRAGQPTNIELFADTVSVATGRVASFRASGRDDAAVTERTRLDSIDLTEETLQDTSLGRALSTSVDQLARRVHEIVFPPATPPTSPDVRQEAPSKALAESAPSRDSLDSDEAPSEEEATPESETKDDDQQLEADEELLQLIAQVEETAAGNPGSSREKTDALRRSVEGLQRALETKSRLLEEGQDTEQADQDLQARREELQEAISRFDEASESDMGTLPESDDLEENREPRAAEKNLAADISGYLDAALGFIQKIQEMRLLLRDAGSGGSETASSEDVAGRPDSREQEEEEDSPSGESAEEESLEEITGVVTEDGAPVEGAVVTEEESGESATTNEDGSYSLKNLPSGIVAKLKVLRGTAQVAEGSVELSRGRPGVADFSLRRGASASLQSRATRALRITASEVAVRPEKAGRNSGTLVGVVEDANGKPVPRALVKLKGLAVARTDSRGQYTFRRVPEGMHRISVQVGGGPEEFRPVRVEARRRAVSRIQLAHTGGFHSGIGASLLSGQTALKETAGVRGTVRDEARRPIAGAKVSLVGASAALGVRTDRAGRYQLRGLKPGSYRILVTRAGYRAARHAVSPGPGAVERLDLQLSRATSSTPLTVQRWRSHLGEIRGRVRGGDRRPIRHATVELRKSGESGSVTQTRTDSDGSYLLKALPGRYQVRARLQSAEAISGPVTLRARGSAQVDLELRRTSRGSSTTTARHGHPADKSAFSRQTNRHPVEPKTRVEGSEKPRGPDDSRTSSKGTLQKGPRKEERRKNLWVRKPTPKPSPKHRG